MWEKFTCKNHLAHDVFYTLKKLPKNAQKHNLKIGIILNRKAQYIVVEIFEKPKILCLSFYQRLG